MDTGKKGRGRTKSSSASDTITAQNDISKDTVNGEEVKMPEKQPDEPEKNSDKDDKHKPQSTEDKGEEKSEVGKDKLTKSRKRKASELKSGDEGEPLNEVSKIAKEKESDTDKSKGVSKDDVDSNDKENVKEADINKEEAKNVEVKDDKKNDAAKGSDVEMKPTDKEKVEIPPSNDQTDIDDPAKQLLGKGKRARIPNKRYSDILLTPTGKPTNLNRSFIENGEKKDSEKIESEDVGSPAVSTLKSRVSTGSPFAKKPKLSIDLSNPNFLKPFKFGWKRELVYRATSDSTTKRNGDIYYYTPSGKKVRSMREVSEHLDSSSELKLEDFTFFKEPLGLDDPEKEIIRDAKIKLGSGSGGSATIVKKSVTPKLVKTPKPKVSAVTPATPKSPPMSATAATPGTSTPKALPRAKTPTAKTPANSKAAASPKAATSPKSATSPKAPATSPAHVSSENSVKEEQPSPAPAPSKTKTPSKLGNFKIKPPAAKKVDKKKSTEESMEIEAGPSSKWSGKKTGKWANSPDSKPCQPCSIRCLAMMGIVPTLQCRLCLCLYHHECVGMPPDYDTQNYVCKNCSLDQEKEVTVSSPVPSLPHMTPPPLLPPPPLTPINALKSTTSVKSAALPKLQRIPRLGDVPPLNAAPVPMPTMQQKPPEMPRLIPRPMQAKLIKVSEAFPQPAENPKSLVGSVTTWLPQNSKIVDNQRSDFTLAESPRPQFVEYLAGRKFLIIPKHNIVTVSPTVAITPSSQPEDIVNTPESNKVPVDSASLGMKDVCDIKPEPESPSKPENTQTEAMDVDVDPAPVATTVSQSSVTMQDSSCQTVQSMEIDDTEKENQTKLTPKKKLSARLNSSSLLSTDKKTEDSKFMDNYLQHLAYGYNTLLYVFQYLKVQDLLKAGCVCTMWRDVASHPLLWRTVRLKNSTVHSFKGLANTLEKHGTAHLDLRKMILPQSVGDSMWPEFNRYIGQVTTLRKIELCRCPAKVIEDLAVSNPQLEIVNAVAIRCETMSVENLSNFTNLRELRLKSLSGFTLTSDLDALQNLKALRHLSLTSVRDLSKLNLGVIAELTNLDSLDLGECMDFPASFGYDVLVKLPKLEKLRLEKGQGNCHTFEILDAIKDMPKLEQLELVNFDIKAGFDKAMGSCTNIKRLLIIPTYISQSATTNHMVLGGVLRLQKTLSHFVWGVTLELLRVTELFVDQCEEPEKKERKREEKEKDKDKKQTTNGDSIPVLKPVPLISDKESEIQPAHDPPQVEILPLPNLQKLLLQSLPTTRVKILKIPFHATWRQSITDSVN